MPPKKVKKKDYGFRSFEGPGLKGKHARITDFMMESKAWGELTCFSITLYLNMKKKYNYHNEDNISFTYKEGMKLMSKKTFTDSIDQLIDLGFIKLIRQSWTSREPNIYGFSDQWQHYGTKMFTITPRLKRSTKKGRVESDPVSG